MKPKMPLQLESQRLLLRQFEDADWPDLHDYYGDVEATRYTFGRALNEASTIDDRIAGVRSSKGSL